MPKPAAVLLRLLLLLAAAACGAAPLRVATLNLRNYNGADRQVEGAWRPGFPKPESEKEAIRTLIHAVHPDVLVLQEIGGPEYLDELRRDLRQEGRDYPHAAHLLAEDADRCLAILATVPLGDSMGHAEIPFQMGGEQRLVRRGLLEVTVHAGSAQLRVFAIHLKSRLSEDTSDPLAAKVRAGEASAVRRLIEDRVGPDTLFLIAGDLNDEPGSAPYKRLTQRAGGVFAVDIRPVDSRGEAWTYHHASADSYERVDYLLASPILAQRYISASGIYDGPAALGGSDHRILWMDLNFSDTLPKN